MDHRLYGFPWIRAILGALLLSLLLLLWHHLAAHVLRKVGRHDEQVLCSNLGVIHAVVGTGLRPDPTLW